MTFEDDFPSLKNKACKKRSSFGIMHFHDEDIQTYCLDKQKVRDALGRLENRLGKQFDETGTYSPYILLNEFEKELGL